MLTRQAADTETFEDAVDTGSVRSLTKRSVSANKSEPPDNGSEVESHEDSDSKDTKPSESAPIDDVKEASGTPVDENEDEEDKTTRRDSSPVSKRFSSTSNLDNVNLEDEVPPAPEGSPHQPA